MKNKIFHTQDPCLHTNSRCTKNSSRMEIIMELLEIAKKRHSVRKYTGKEIEQEKLDKILEAAHVAPTAANMQPVRLIVVKSKEGLEKVGKAANIYQAPAAIVVCANKTKAWKRPFDGKITTDIDASILTDHMMLEATELGLGSVWICYFNPDILKEELNLPENLEPVNILALGYSDELDASAERHKDMRIGMDRAGFLPLKQIACTTNKPVILSNHKIARIMHQHPNVRF